MEKFCSKTNRIKTQHTPIEIYIYKCRDENIIRYLDPLPDIWKIDERYFSISNNMEDAHFILFPYSIDNLYHQLGVVEFIRTLRQLTLFDHYEHKFIFIFSDDIGRRFNVKSVLYRVNHDKNRKDANSITLPYFFDDFLFNEGNQNYLYHVNFVGTIVTHLLRAYMLIPFLQKKDLKLYNSILEKLEVLLANRKDPNAYDRMLSNTNASIGTLFPRTVSTGGISYYLDIAADQFPRLSLPVQRERKTRFISAMQHSAAVLCPRGFGVQSIRFFETMSASRIPILISDDYALPLEKRINYDSFALKIDEKKIMDLPKKISHFFNSYSNEDIIRKGEEGRKIWKRYFSPSKHGEFMRLTLSEVLENGYRLNNC